MGAKGVPLLEEFEVVLSPGYAERFKCVEAGCMHQTTEVRSRRWAES